MRLSFILILIYEAIDKLYCFLCCRVKNWALKFGVDLWEFGRHFTKMNQIQNVSINLVNLAVIIIITT